MTRDILARAKAQDLSAAPFGIGDYLLQEPDPVDIRKDFALSTPTRIMLIGSSPQADK